jgi:hypothetical protein
MSSQRANNLAVRLERGAEALASLAAGLSEADWKLTLSPDKRTIGVIVHHVASMYPLEIQLARVLAAGNPIEGVTSADVDRINTQHAADFADTAREAAIDLLRRNSAAAAAAIRALSDEELDRAAPVSLYGDAPLTCQFFLEDHAMRHSYHHLAKIRRAILQPV